MIGFQIHSCLPFFRLKNIFHFSFCLVFFLGLLSCQLLYGSSLPLILLFYSCSMCTAVISFNSSFLCGFLVSSMLLLWQMSCWWVLLYCCLLCHHQLLLFIIFNSFSFIAVFSYLYILSAFSSITIIYVIVFHVAAFVSQIFPFVVNLLLV